LALDQARGGKGIVGAKNAPEEVRRTAEVAVSAAPIGTARRRSSGREESPTNYQVQGILGAPMLTAYLIVTLLAIAANAFSGVAALAHFKPIIPGMVKAGVPESWLTFPIGTLKTAGAVGLLIGLIGAPLIGIAAAIGLILFFVCAIYTHVRASDYSPQFGLAIGFLLLAVAALGLGLNSSLGTA
jgi:hypothetical protein